MRSQLFKTNIFILLILAVFMFGLWGFFIYESSEYQAFDFWGAIYAILGFFVLETTNPIIPNVQLTISKFLAACILGYGFFQLAYTHIIVQWNVIKIKIFYSNHFIIIGLGYIGRQLAMDLLQNGHKVIILEKNNHNDSISLMQQNGAIIFFGKGNIHKLLKFSKVSEANQIVICTGDDNINMTTTNNIVQIVQSTRKFNNPLRLLVHINEESNNNILKDYIDFDLKNAKIDIDTFNIIQAGSQLVYDKHFPFSYLNQFTPDTRISILIWGNNLSARYFLMENIILSHAPYVKLEIILADTDVESFQNEIKLKFPFINQFLTISVLPLQNNIFQFDEEKTEIIKNKFKHLKVAYVFSEKDSLVIERAGYLRQFFYDTGGTLAQTAVVGTLSEGSEVVSLLSNPNNKNNILNIYTQKLNVSYINVFDDACRGDRIIFESEIQDFIAKTVNYMYSIKYETPYILKDLGYSLDKNDTQRIEKELFDMKIKTKEVINEIDEKMYKIFHEVCNLPKKTYYEKFSINSKWFELTDRKKDSNRYVARHLKLKMHFLNSLGHEEVSIDTIEELFHLLAPIEHARWMSEKLVFGFRFGSLEDKNLKKILKDILKVHDQIMPYNELTHAEQSKDMDMFYLIPLLTQIQKIIK